MFHFPSMLPVLSSLSLDSWQPVKRRYNSQTAVYLKLVWASAHRMASSHPETHLLSNFFCWYWWKSFKRMTHWKFAVSVFKGFLGLGWGYYYWFLPTSRITLRPRKFIFSKSLYLNISSSPGKVLHLVLRISFNFLYHPLPSLMVEPLLCRS